jgi:hypothetical protein
MSNNPYSAPDNAYTDLFTETYIPDIEYETFSVTMDDDRLSKMLIDSLDENVSFWDKSPWKLRETDENNTAYLLGDQVDKSILLRNQSNKYIDNRLFSSYRAILSYATGQLAVPELTPSRGDDIYVHAAQKTQGALYQHAADNKVDMKARIAVGNLITRKRGCLKLRYDPNKGLGGDIVTEVVNPEDIIIDRNAGYLDNPNIIYHRIRCPLEELTARFPDKQTEILQAFSVKQGRFTQMSRLVTYFEAWFTYYDDTHQQKEGVCWFIPEKKLILDKMPNPNWIYGGNTDKEKTVNVTDMPPKPFVWFNYINTGHSYIDDTCLFEQAKPLQEMLNYREQQLNQNIDFMNGRWVASKKAFAEEDAQKLVNRGARTVALVDADDVNKAIAAVTPNLLPKEVFQSVMDLRSEIDNLMGTPSQFRGASPSSQDTATRDLMVKQQAGMLQDDLVRCVADGMETYYKILLQMWRVYYTEDHWFQTRGGDGKFEFILINGNQIDQNCKVSVQVDSTLPLDKANIRTTAMELWKSGQAIDYKQFMEDLGLPNPDIRTERYMKQQLDPIGYLRAVEGAHVHDEAEADIQILIDGKMPEERDVYDTEYINYYNDFLTTNRFAKQDQAAKQRVVQFLMTIQQLAVNNMNLKSLILDDAGTIPTPAPAPMVPGQLGAAPTDPNAPQVPGQPQPPQAAPTPAVV